MAILSLRDRFLHDFFAFKTIMLLLSTLAGSFLMALHLRRGPDRFLQRGLVAGLLWLAVNWLLDFAALLPLSGMPAGEYFTQIGLRYLGMPITGVSMGYAMDGVGAKAAGA